MTLLDIGMVLFVIAWLLGMIAMRIGVPASEIRWLWIGATVVMVMQKVWP